MADLQCAARILVARHGEAAYESDLLHDHGGSLTATGRQQSAALAEALVGSRIAHVYASSMSRAVQTAEIVAARLGVGVTVREGLREFSVGDHVGTSPDHDPFAATFADWLDGRLETRLPGAESGREVVDRMAAVLEEAADAHRGETVLVVSHGGAICTAVPHLALNLAPRFPHGRPLPNCGVVELEADADGWVARRWVDQDLDGRTTA
jgi:probable phosphoglycerate mutase